MYLPCGDVEDSRTKLAVLHLIVRLVAN